MKIFLEDRKDFEKNFKFQWILYTKNGIHIGSGFSKSKKIAISDAKKFMVEIRDDLRETTEIYLKI